MQSPDFRATHLPRPAGALSASLEATLDNIRDTFSHVSERQIADIVALLANPRSKAMLIGGRFTDPVARYMAAHLAIIRPNVFHLAGQESNWRDRLIDMDRRDVLLVFDIRRYQDSLLRLAETAQARGVQIVLFTDQWLSPIARFARHIDRRTHRGALAVGFLGRPVRRRRDADRRTDPPAGARTAHGASAKWKASAKQRLSAIKRPIHLT